MDNTLARRHPVQFARCDLLFRSEAVAVKHLSVKQPSDSRKPDMRVRPDILTLAGLHRDGAKLIKEDKRSHHLTLTRWQRTAHFKISNIAHPGDDDDGQRIGGNSIARHRIGDGEAELAEWVQTETDRPFDLRTGPLQQGQPQHRPGDPVLLLTVHHIAVDFWSIDVILDELRGRKQEGNNIRTNICLLYTSPSPRDRTRSRMPSSA